MNLYELQMEYAQLQLMLEDPDINPQVVLDSMEAVAGEIEAKADGYAKIIRNMEGSITAVKAEQEKLANKRRTLEAGVERLKKWLQDTMISTGKRKFQTELFSFSIQKNGGKDPVILDVDVSDLPDDLVVVTEKPDLNAIADYIKSTGDMTYAHFGERGESLRIR